MALSFPIPPAALIDLLAVDTIAWNLTPQQEYSGLGSGEGLAHDLAPALWEGDCSTVARPHREIERMRARFLALDGSIGSFLLYGRNTMFPATDPDGTLLGGAAVRVGTVAANRKELSFAGLPAGYRLSWGDFVSIVYGGSRYALVQLLADAVADGSGSTGMVEVRPHLRPGIGSDAPVSLVRPSAKVKLVPGSLWVETVTHWSSRLRFSARQTLSAD